jgi:hypothetical protein
MKLPNHSIELPQPWARSSLAAAGTAHSGAWPNPKLSRALQTLPLGSSSGPGKLQKHRSACLVPSQLQFAAGMQSQQSWCQVRASNYCALDYRNVLLIRACPLATDLVLAFIGIRRLKAIPAIAAPSANSRAHILEDYILHLDLSMAT